MKCPACNAQWTLPPNSRGTGDRCPFCGASLLTDAPAGNLEHALRKIRAMTGEQGLRNGSALLSCFADVAPELKKERLLLSYLIHNGTHLKLMDACGASPEQQKLIYNRAILTLHQEQFIVREAAELVCTGFLAALDVTVPKSTPVPAKPPVTPPAKQPVTPPAKQPVTPPAPKAAAAKIPAAANAPQDSKTSIRTYEDYIKALRELYTQNGNRPLNNAQILRFLWQNQLDKRFGITREDIEQDLKTLYPPATRSPAPSSQPPVEIRTYADYKKALTALFIRNGRKLLTDEQIFSFLSEYNLEIRFGITPGDVLTDLKALRAGTF